MNENSMLPNKLIKKNDELQGHYAHYAESNKASHSKSLHDSFHLCITGVKFRESMWNRIF